MEATQRTRTNRDTPPRKEIHRRSSAGCRLIQNTTLDNIRQGAHSGQPRCRWVHPNSFFQRTRPLPVTPRNSGHRRCPSPENLQTESVAAQFWMPSILGFPRGARCGPDGTSLFDPVGVVVAARLPTPGCASRPRALLLNAFGVGMPVRP